jgi:hypothetical protein
VPSGAGGKGAVDTLQFSLRAADSVVLFKADEGAAAKRSLYPAFCLTRGCISGPAIQARTEALRDSLGWAPLEADGGEDERWVQLLLH